MIKLTDSDARFVFARLPKDIQALMMKERVFLAGGFIRETIAGNRPHDIDLFGGSAMMLKGALNALKEDRPGSRLFHTDNAATLLTMGRMPVQVITRWLYDDPAVLMHDFDFTVCQAVIWCEPGSVFGVRHLVNSVCHDEFYSDLAARRLNYTSPQRTEDAGGSMLRVRKFLARGYNIQPPSLGRVIARLVKAVRNPENMTEEMAGQVVAGLLLEVDPFNVVDGIEFLDEPKGQS